MEYFSEEIFDEEFVEEINPLVENHYQEIAHFKEIELNPDYSKYIHLYNEGRLKLFTVRDQEDGELVGYAIFSVNYNLHYKQSLQALQDVIYIKPERRGFGKKFIDFCDSQLKDMGVEAVYHHVKVEHNFGPLLEKLGYELIDLVYGKRL